MRALENGDIFSQNRLQPGQKQRNLLQSWPGETISRTVPMPIQSLVSLLRAPTVMPNVVVDFAMLTLVHVEMAETINLFPVQHCTAIPS